MFWNAFLTLDNQGVHQLLVQAIRKVLRVVKQNLLNFHQGLGDLLCGVGNRLHNVSDNRRNRYNRHNRYRSRVTSHKHDSTITITDIYHLCDDTLLRGISLCNQQSPLFVCLKSQLCNTSIGDFHLHCFPRVPVAKPRVVTQFAALGATRGHLFLALFVCLFFVVHCQS